MDPISRNGSQRRQMDTFLSAQRKGTEKHVAKRGIYANVDRP